jgi:aryl sulfotransferase
MPSVQNWLDTYLSRDTALGSWAEHVDSTWRLRDRPNVLFITYEQMRANLPDAVDKIAELMGVALTTDERAAVIERASFAHMRKIGYKFEPNGAPWRAGHSVMIRKGESGQSGELLSAAQQQRTDDYWRGELRRLGCDFPYDEAFRTASGTSSST